MIHHPNLEIQSIYISTIGARLSRSLLGSQKRLQNVFPIPSMDCIFTYIYLHLPSKSTIHVGKYAIVPWIRSGFGKGTLTCRKVVRAARPSGREVFWSVTGNGTNGGAGGTLP